VVSVDAYRMASHDAAVALADEALYAAKHQGRDRYVAIDPAAPRTDPDEGKVTPFRDVSAG